MIKRTVAILILMCVSAFAQTAAQWDSTNVTLTNLDTDTTLFRFDNKPYQRAGLTTISSLSASSLKFTKPGQRAYLPDTMAVIFDSTNVSGGAADSFRVAWSPLNPISGAIISGSTVYIRGGASTFGTITDGLTLGVPLLNWYSAYVMTITRGDSTAGVQRIRTIFVRRE